MRRQIFTIKKYLNFSSNTNQHLPLKNYYPEVFLKECKYTKMKENAITLKRKKIH